MLFDIESARPFRQLVGHLGTVWAVAPSPDGRYLLSAADDQTLRVWSWKEGKLLLSLFFAGRQWITWTPAGYYAASPGGERLMGWHVNRGRTSLSSFYPASHFRKSLYRPELIGRLIEVGSVELALQQANRPAARVPTSVQEVLPPEVKIVQPATSPSDVSAIAVRGARRCSQSK